MTVTMEKCEAALLPFFLCRISALPVEKVLALGCQDTLNSIQEVVAMDATLHTVGKQVSEELHTLIGRTPDAKERGALLRLRRALHNQRPLSEADEELIEATGHTVSTLIRTCLQLQESRTTARTTAMRQYDGALMRCTSKLERLARDPMFEAGLLLSTVSLFNAKHRGISHGNEKRASKVARSVLRYLSRSAMKATPFGRFCTVVSGEIIVSGYGDPTLDIVGRLDTPRSIVRANLATLRVLMPHLMSSQRIRQQLTVELNPTVEASGGKLVFLMARGSGEVFQRVEISDALLLVTAMMREFGRVRVSELVKALTTDPRFETSEEDALTFIDGLLNIGLVRICFGLRDQDVDWLAPLAAQLADIDDPTAVGIVEYINAFQPLVALYAESADVQLRSTIVKAMHSHGRELCTQLNVDSRGWPTLPIMEDVTADASVVLRGGEQLREMQASLVDFVDMTRRFAWPRIEQFEMRHYFDNKYPGAKSVALLEFYEDYYRDHLKRHVAMEARPDRGRSANYDVNNPFRLENVDKLRRAPIDFMHVIAKSWSSARLDDEMHVALKDIRRSTSSLPELSDDPCSVAVFGNLLPSGRLLLGGSYGGGFGRMFSRFLNLVPPAFYHEVKYANTRFGPDILAEIAGANLHNANLHPPVLDWEISYPTGESSRRTNAIDAKNLRVERHPENDHVLVLRADSGIRVVPLDLGFQWRKGRPPLYQLLCLFSPASFLSIPLPTHPFPNEFEQAQLPNTDATHGDITYRPRIVVEGSVVIARRCWSLNLAHLPQKAKAETSYAFYERINQWRLAHGIPDRIFVRVFVAPTDEAVPTKPANSEIDPVKGGAAPKRGNPSRRHGNHHKPQFIDFSNPLLVQLLGALGIGNSNGRFVIEECLPEPDSLPVHNGFRYATEQVFQLDRYVM